MPFWANNCNFQDVLLKQFLADTSTHTCLLIYVTPNCTRICRIDSIISNKCPINALGKPFQLPQFRQLGQFGLPSSSFFLFCSPPTPWPRLTKWPAWLAMRHVCYPLSHCPLSSVLCLPSLSAVRCQQHLYNVFFHLSFARFMKKRNRENVKEQSSKSESIVTPGRSQDRVESVLR